jgi:chemotaxis protein CheD
MTGPTGNQTVGLGHYAVGRDGGTLACLGLGSCVAVVLHDLEARVGGLAHVVLPSASLSRDRSNPGRFAETAVPLLIAEALRAGAARGRLAARLVGGASMFTNLVPAGAVQMGQRNINACRAALEAAAIPIVGEAVGGEIGRSVWLTVESGVLTVRSVGREPERL